MIYFNGKIIALEQAYISPADRGLLLGDGLFETIRADHGRILHWEQHWQRFKQSADFLEIPVSLNSHGFADIMNELLNCNSLSDRCAGLRLTLTRGCGPRGLLPPLEVTPTVMISAFAFESVHPSPVRICVVSIRRNEFSPLSRIKSLNYLDNILAKRAAVKAGAQEAILLNSQGHVAEASAANIFLVKQGQLVTPRIEDGALPGIMRQTVLGLAEKLNIPRVERIVKPEELEEADEIFLTNSLIMIQPVNQLGPVTASLQKPILLE